MPTPTETLNARGSWRGKGRKKRGKGVVAGVSIPVKPASLSEAASVEWDLQVEALAGLGILSAIDHAALAVWCEAWADFTEANAKVLEMGKMVKGSRKTPIINPWYRIRREAMDTILKFAQQFGLSPAARVRVKAETKADDSDKKGKGRFFKVAEGT